MDRSFTEPYRDLVVPPEPEWWRKRLSVDGYATPPVPTAKLDVPRPNFTRQGTSNSVQTTASSLAAAAAPRRSMNLQGLIPQVFRGSGTSVTAVSRSMAERWVLEAREVSFLDFLQENPDDYLGFVRRKSWLKQKLMLLKTMSSASSSKAVEHNHLENSTLSSPPNNNTTNANNAMSSTNSITKQPKFRESMLDDILMLKEAKAVYMNLSLLLQNPLGCDEFEAFLITSFSHENLAFYQAVQRVQLMANPPTDVLLEVFSEYVVEDAPRMVNLSGALQRDITDCAMQLAKKSTPRQQTSEPAKKTATPHDDTATTAKNMVKLLILAQKDVYNMLERDCFHRYISDTHASREWRLLCVDASRAVNDRLRAKSGTTPTKRKHTIKRSLSSSEFNRRPTL